jgi:surface protein
MFRNCNSFETLDLSDWNTSEVVSFEGMFYDCKNLENLDLTNWNPKKIYNVMWMFKNCTRLKTVYVSPEFSVSRVNSSTNDIFD